MPFRKRNILFLLCPKKKFFGSRTVRKNISVFLTEENLEEKKQPPPHENQMVGP